MPALYPATVAPEDFKIGDQVKKMVSDRAKTPYMGIITNIIPGIHKVDVQWPMGNSRESPEELIIINPVFSMPSVKKDTGYSSYDKAISEKLYGRVPKKSNSSDRMPIRVAHNFAANIVGNLIGDAADYYNRGFTDLQAYNYIYKKHASTCSDHIIRYAIQRVYKSLKKHEEI